MVAPAAVVTVWTPWAAASRAKPGTVSAILRWAASGNSCINSKPGSHWRDAALSSGARVAVVGFSIGSTISEGVWAGSVLTAGRASGVAIGEAGGVTTGAT